MGGETLRLGSRGLSVCVPSPVYHPYFGRREGKELCYLMQSVRAVGAALCIYLFLSGANGGFRWTQTVPYRGMVTTNLYFPLRARSLCWAGTRYF
ncbi:hypothetical protein BJY00DRAFT_279305 [Aspergillus carlsbadensis]|nr:hypothetical protein BJY00DRAFT_279305 [Aspergillus carlsbadensis]